MYFGSIVVWIFCVLLIANLAKAIFDNLYKFMGGQSKKSIVICVKEEPFINYLTSILFQR